MSSFDFVCVSGYGRSGSSACIDLLKEFEFVDGPDKEFRIAKDPHGLLDLELSIVDNWEFIRHDTAINDFLEYCSMLGRGESIFKKVGKNFSDILYIDFMKESIEYVNRINNFTYFGDTLLHRYRLNALQSFKQRLNSKLGLSNAALMHFSRPTKERFLVETNRYLRRLFENYAANKNIHKVVLDQAISPTNIKKTLKYFDNAKLIIVDRDPRDIYATMLKEKCFLGADVINRDSVHKYIKWHRDVRKQVAQDIDEVFTQDRVLRLNFEDLFFCYEKTILDIKEFLDIDFNHKDKGSKFNVKTIRENVGIWKTFPDKDVMLHIKKELDEYCFTYEKNNFPQ
jgi:hypothetical protein